MVYALPFPPFNVCLAATYKFTFCLKEELWKLDEELGVEEDIKIWKRTQDVLKSTKEHRKHRKKGKRNKHAVTDEHAQKGDSIGRQSVPSKRMSLSTSRDVGREEKVFNVSGVPDAVELDDIETTESKKMIWFGSCTVFPHHFWKTIRTLCTSGIAFW